MDVCDVARRHRQDRTGARPDRAQTCSCERQQDSSVSQALHLNNGQTLNNKLRSKNSSVEQWLNEKISDEEAVWLSKDIARRIENEFEYPGQIKVTVIRETRAVDYAK